jgi:hypothetical protein
VEHTQLSVPTAEMMLHQALSSPTWTMNHACWCNGKGFILDCSSAPRLQVWWIDAVGGILISIYILWSWWSISKEQVRSVKAREGGLGSRGQLKTTTFEIWFGEVSNLWLGLFGPDQGCTGHTSTGLRCQPCFVHRRHLLHAD